MNIETSLDELFDKKCVAKPDKPRDTATLDLKKIESQLNNHLMSKQGKKYKRVTLFNFSEQINKNAFNEMIDNDIETKYRNKKWSVLPMYLKWQYAESYLIEKGLLNPQTTVLVKGFINERNDKRFEYDHRENILKNILLEI